MSTINPHLQGSRSEIVAAIESAGGRMGQRDAVFCPFHGNERTPAASIKQSESDGVWRLTCHNPNCGFHGDIYDIEQKAGLSDGLGCAENERNGTVTARTAPRATQETAYPSIEAVKAIYERQGFTVESVDPYTDPDTGLPDMQVLRLRRDGDKTFRQVFLTPRGWVLSRPEGFVIPIFNRKRIKGAAQVVVVEGEKDVRTLTKLGIVATTSPMGAGNAAKADWSPLAGKRVIIWPDNDTEGAKYAETVRGILTELGCEVATVDVSALGLPDKGDVSDYVAGSEDPQAIVQDVLAETEFESLSAGAVDQLEAMRSGRWRSLPMTLKVTSVITKAMMPGKVLLLCGDPEAGKSFWIMQEIIQWVLAGEKVAWLALEEDEPFWQIRAMVHQAGFWNLGDDEWHREHPDESREFESHHRDIMDLVGRIITCAPDREFTQKDMLDYIRRQAELGKRVIVVDPVTAVAASDKIYVSDTAFVCEVKRIARKHECTIVLVTHPTKEGKPSMAGISGGAVYARLVQTILWLSKLSETQDVDIWTKDGPTPMPINRILWAIKARNSSGGGTRIGVLLTGPEFPIGEQVQFLEKGRIIMKKKKGKR